MGPCPFRHGYADTAAPTMIRAAGFNGAMPFQAWIQGTRPSTTRIIEGFNGAMPFQAWILDEARASNNLEFDGFNGAMPFQAWIRGMGVHFNKDRTTLQWGHALSGMDTFDCCFA